MKKYIKVLCLSGLLCFAGMVLAESLSVGSNDSIQTILAAHKGNAVTIRLTSGGEITGKVGEVNNAIVHLMGLSGREFFDAVAPIQKIEAVIIRTQ